MSRDNPMPALDALAGKTYKLHGKTVRNSNLVTFALAKSGYGIETLTDSRFLEALPIVAFALLNPVEDVMAVLSGGGDLMRAGLEFCEDFAPEEMGEIGAVFQDCLVRFKNSMARTAGNGSAPGNAEAAADIA